MTSILLIIGGFILLLVGGEALVRGSVAVASRMGVSKLVIGLTLVGFGTSAPELMTSVQAALAGSSGIAIGNVVGSNIANILLIIGASAVIYPLACPKEAIRRDGAVMIAATLTLIALSLLFGEIGRISAGILIICLINYLLWTFYQERKSGGTSAEMHEHETETFSAPMLKAIPFQIFLVVVGIIVLIFGADLLVEGATDLAKTLGVSDSIIGLTVVAVGTSLPELATSIMAAIKRQADVAIGNVIGSNIFNIFSILGITALIQPIDIPQDISGIDNWVMLATAIVLVVFGLTGSKITRAEGIVLLISYIAYIGFMALR
jgi:cation:H+ antiporter